MSKQSPFPWHYYIRAVRSSITHIVLASLLTYLAFTLYPESFFGKEGLVILFLSVMVLIQSFFRVSPMRDILARVESVQEQLPHDKKLDLIYQKNEFELIEEMIDLTEAQLKLQKESYENQLIQSDTVLEYIPNAVVIVDKFQNCKQFNKQFYSKFIQNRDVQGVEQIKLWKIFDKEEFVERFERVISTGERASISGKYFPWLNEYFDIALAPVSDTKGKITGALGIFHNVTKSKLTEKMRVDFVANVSHEIRTPLTSIKGYTQLLQAHTQSIPEDLKPILGKINSNTERLKELFDNLLKLSVIESKGEISKEIFEVVPMVNMIAARLKGKYLHKRFEVKVSGECKVCGDKKLLEQVFSNLIDNALKYSDKADTLVEVEISHDEESNLIKVRDNGLGFAPDEEERIFERFYRIQGQVGHVIEGSGLGLSIVKHILQKHQGSIKATSKKGEGSTFTICLPRIAEC